MSVGAAPPGTGAHSPKDESTDGAKRGVGDAPAWTGGARATVPAPGDETCPLCNAPLDPEQEWCLRCGAAARTRLATSPTWKAPIVALAVVAVLSLGVLAAALVKLAGGSGSNPTTTITVTLPVAATPTQTTPAAPTTAPGATHAGTATSGATTPGAGTPGARTSPATTPGATGLATGATGTSTSPASSSTGTSTSPAKPSGLGSAKVEKRLRELLNAIHK